MKIQTVVGSVESNVPLDRTTFSVNHSAHLFQVISTSLYTQPLRAIVREITCNAIDSHIKAGKPDLPVKVTLPGAWSNSFSIQDFGVGLTPEQIKEVYTVVFKSDKQDSDDLTGAFGLGSKSIFSYAQSFDIESNVDGKKYIYKAYLNESGIPELADLSSGGFDTDQENGVKISFEVNKNDVWRLRNDCFQTFLHFEVMPDIQNDDELKNTLKEHIKITNPPVQTEVGEVMFYTIKRPEGQHKHTYGYISNRYFAPENNESALYIVMGGVRYPINSELFQHELSGIMNDYYSSRTIKVPIGCVTPQASREHLQYDERTKNNISLILKTLKEKDLQATKEAREEIEALITKISLECFKVNPKTNSRITNAEDGKLNATVIKKVEKELNKLYDLYMGNHSLSTKAHLAGLLNNINGRFTGTWDVETYLYTASKPSTSIFTEIKTLFLDDCSDFLENKKIKSGTNRWDFRNVISQTTVNDDKFTVYVSALDDKFSWTRLRDKWYENEGQKRTGLKSREIFVTKSELPTVKDFLNTYLGKKFYEIKDVASSEFDLKTPKPKKPKSLKPKGEKRVKKAQYLYYIIPPEKLHSEHVRGWSPRTRIILPAGEKELTLDEVEAFKGNLLTIHINPKNLVDTQTSKIYTVSNTLKFYNENVTNKEKTSILIIKNRRYEMKEISPLTKKYTTVGEFSSWLLQVTAQDRMTYALKDLSLKKNALNVFLSDEDAKANPKLLEYLKKIWIKQVVLEQGGYNNPFDDYNSTSSYKKYLIPVEFHEVSEHQIEHLRQANWGYNTSNKPEHIRLVKFAAKLIERYFKITFDTGGNTSSEKFKDSRAEVMEILLEKLVNNNFQFNEEYFKNKFPKAEFLNNGFEQTF